MGTADKTGVRICHAWEGKAGGYAIQGAAAKFIDRIEGDYYNVVGLSVCSLYHTLKELGYIKIDGSE